MKNYPAWLGKLSQRDEARRRAEGLYPAKDGWYKTVQLKKRYIAKPMPLADVLQVLPARMNEILGQVEERPARLAVNSTTIEGLAEIFTSHLWQRHATGQPKKLARRTYDDYADVLSRFIECVGPEKPASAIDPTWFSKFARSIAHKAASSRRRDMIYLTAFFNWAGPGRHSLNFYKTPVSFGPDFRRPDEQQMLAELAETSTLYTPEQYFNALMAVRENPLLYAVGLLGLNCAFLASDITSITDDFLDLDAGVHTFPRPKTKIDRKAVLMPETVKAIRDYIRVRPERPEGVTNVFVRDDGRPWSIRRNDDPDTRASHGNAVGQYWARITGLPIKGLRTTFATTADGFEDQRAVDVVMGHSAKTVRSKFYVKHFELQRLRTVIERVWQQCVYAVPLPSEASISAAELQRRVESQASPRATG